MAECKDCIHEKVCKFASVRVSVGTTVREIIHECSDYTPTADVAEVKHGEWYLLDECSNEGVYCSICHKKVYRKDYANQKVKSKYCPNCGVKMDRGDKK